MVKARIPETDHGIQGEITVQIYDTMLRRLRDKGWLETRAIVEAGITSGKALEIGPGPGYLGLEWLQATEGTTLKGLDISPDMIALAEKNAREYQLQQRVDYVESDGKEIPFDQDTFDGVFSNGSLHEWAKPVEVFNEIFRVLKPGGICFVSDLRRDINPLIRWLMLLTTKPKEIKPGFRTSLNASYTVDEIQALLRETNWKQCTVKQAAFGLVIIGKKAG